MKRAALYICYNTIDEPLVKSQVVSYLRELAKSDIEIHLLTFDGEMSKEKILSLNQALTQSGITWHTRRYHQRPSLPATLYDVVVGAFTAWRIARKNDIRLIHARSHPPAAMALLLQRILGYRWVFDLRGLMAEEYADGGHWQHGDRKFQMTKRMERMFLRRADALVMLTQRIKDELISTEPVLRQRADDISVIPCCVDIRRFETARALRSIYRQERSWSERRVLVYAGKVGSWYMAEEMVRFFRMARQLDSRFFFQVLTQEDPVTIRRAFEKLRVSEGDFDIRYAAPEDVPTIMCAADVSISFRKGEYSKLAASPTKVGESLAAGLPLITNAGIGDCDRFLNGNRVGVILRDFSEPEYLRGAEALFALMDDDQLTHRCRELAKRQFSLSGVGGPMYLEVYQRLFSEEQKTQ